MDGVDPAIIPAQHAAGWPDFHPEDYCHRCGRPNIAAWHVASHLWQRATEGLPGGTYSILCPPCFTALHEAATGETCSWELTPSSPFIPSQEVED